MNFRLTRSAEFYNDIDQDDVDPDREPQVSLPAGAVLTDVEVDRADDSVGLHNGSVIGTYGGKLLGWLGSDSEARDVFEEYAPDDVATYLDPQIRVTANASPSICRAFNEHTQLPWVIGVSVSNRYSTSHVEVLAVSNAERVENGDDPEGYYLWWSGGTHSCWSIERISDRATDMLYDDEYGRPATGSEVVAAALANLPLDAEASHG